jgi:hypothetical protein
MTAFPPTAKQQRVFDLLVEGLSPTNAETARLTTARDAAEALCMRYQEALVALTD